MLSSIFAKIKGPLCNFWKFEGFLAILERFVAKMGFGKIYDQNMTLGKFGVQINFGSKCKYEKVYDSKWKYDKIPWHNENMLKLCAKKKFEKCDGISIIKGKYDGGPFLLMCGPTHLLNMRWVKIQMQGPKLNALKRLGLELTSKVG